MRQQNLAKCRQCKNHDDWFCKETRTCIHGACGDAPDAKDYFVPRLKRWVCKECPQPCWLQTDAEPDSCIIYKDRVAWQEDERPPQPAPEPELMTAVEAVQACKGVGGAIWHHAENTHRVTIDANGKIIEGNLAGLSSTQPFYTVRPLSDPYPLDFDEAWEALGSGKCVELKSEPGATKVKLVPEISTELQGCYGIPVKELHGKKFRIANPD